MSFANLPNIIHEMFWFRKINVNKWQTKKQKNNVKLNKLSRLKNRQSFVEFSNIMSSSNAIPKDIINLIGLYIIDGHTNSKYKTYKHCENSGFVLCYDCKIPLSFLKSQFIKNFKREFHTVCNSVIYERSFMELHFITLCEDCLVNNTKFNNKFFPQIS